MSSKPSGEEELRRIIAEVRFLEDVAEALRSRINVINAALTERILSSRTLEGLEKEKENVSLFVPIGGGSYIMAKLESVEKVIVGIGAGVAVEKTLNEAKEILSKRIEELEKLRMALQQQLSQVIEKVQEDREKLQVIAQKMATRA